MILSIESSCDDSSIAITKIKDFTLVFHKKISQELEHNKYGGVVPELAARLHAKALPEILKQAKPYFSKLKAIAVTNEPGLTVTLVEGVVMAKALSISLNIPLIAINHLKGHIYSPFIGEVEQFPMGVLLVSGGHTQVLNVKAYNDIFTIATTLDDSFGESFDKVSKMLGLGYPGGAIVEKYAKNGDKNRFNFTVPMSNSPKLAFSYSGLKNQTRLQIQDIKNLNNQDISDICASFQKTAVLHLIQKLKKIFKIYKFSKFCVVGGASANLFLRNELINLCKNNFCELIFPQMQFCSDNAAMIGRAAVEAFLKKEFIDINDVKINPKTFF